MFCFGITQVRDMSDLVQHFKTQIIILITIILSILDPNEIIFVLQSIPNYKIVNSSKSGFSSSSKTTEKNTKHINLKNV